MRALFPILPHHMVGEKALSAARRAEDELVPVGHHPLFHGQVRYVEEDGLSRQPVHHAQPEGGKRVPVAGFCRKEA